MKSIDLSVVIVSYNTQELLRSCLTSLMRYCATSFTTEIFVYDNASVDGSADMVGNEFPSVMVIRGKENVGFAKANNFLIKKTKGRYILLLNSDTEVREHTLSDSIRFMDSHEKEYGACTCKLVLPDGSMDPSCHRGFPTPWAAVTYFTKLETLFPTSPLFGQYHQGYKQMDTIHDIDSPSGAFFLVRRRVIEEIGLLDETYFMYAEDLDWAYRMKQKGYRIAFNPRAVCLHVKKQSGRSNADPKIQIETQRHFYDTMRLFYRKHYRAIYPRVVTLLVEQILTLRMIILSTLGL